MRRLALVLVIAACAAVYWSVRDERGGGAGPLSPGPRVESSEALPQPVRAPEFERRAAPPANAEPSPTPRASPEAAPTPPSADGSATLDVLVEDYDGAPVSDTLVELGLAPCERHAPPTPAALALASRAIQARTDPAGVARLAGAPPGVRLTVRVGGERFEHVGRGNDGDREPLLPEVAPSARALVLAPSAVRRFHARVAPTIALTGTVLGSDGSAAKAARVFVSELTLGTPPRLEYLAQATSDTEGRFQLTVQPSATTQELLLVADAAAPATASPSPFGGRTRPRTTELARARVAVPRAAPRKVEVELRLATLGVLQGTVVDEQGQPVAGAELHLRQTSGSSPELERIARAQRYETVAQDMGRFEFTGLPPGTYSLTAEAELRGSAALAGLQPDGERVTVRLGPPSTARVTIEVHAGEPLGRTVVLSSDLVPHAHVTVDAPILARTTDVRGAGGWPRSAGTMWSGGQRSTSEQGRESHLLRELEGTQHTLEVAPGLHVFGARGFTASGVPLARLGTGLVRVGPGEHVVRLHLVPAGRLAGCVVGMAPDEVVALALEGPGGTRLTVAQGEGHLADVFELPASGRFALSDVPAGPVTVVIGTPAELATPGAGRRHSLAVRAGTTPEVELAR